MYLPVIRKNNKHFPKKSAKKQAAEAACFGLVT